MNFWPEVGKQNDWLAYISDINVGLLHCFGNSKKLHNFKNHKEKKRRYIDKMISTVNIKMGNAG